MRAALLAGRGLVLETVDDPTPAPGQLVVEVRCAGICGSDLAAPHYLPDGSVLGHELCGEVVEIGADPVGHWAVGDLVTALPVLGCGACGACLSGDAVHCRHAQYLGLSCPGAFAEYVVVGSRETIRLPDSIDAPVGALIEPIAIGLHQVRAGGVGAGSSVAVIGCGPIGLAVIAWSRTSGAARIVASDPVAARRDLAVACGADRVVDPSNDENGATLNEACHEEMGARPDVVFDCAGSLLGAAIDLVRLGGNVVEAAYAARPVPIDVPRALVKEVTVSFPSWYRSEEFHTSIDAIAHGRVPAARMVTHRVRLDELPGAFAALQQPSDQGKVIVEQ